MAPALSRFQRIAEHRGVALSLFQNDPASSRFVALITILNRSKQQPERGDGVAPARLNAVARMALSRDCDRQLGQFDGLAAVLGT